MGNGMNKILTGLYIGSVRDSKDMEQLKTNCITHIISIHDNARKGGLQDIEYLCILASDSPNQNLSQFFPQCNDFIHCARLSGGSVFIHCLAGVSRSVTIAVAYLMSVTSLNCKEALEALRGARSISAPNYGFQRQLEEFELRRLKAERKRLNTKFSQKLFQIQDEEEVRKLIGNYHSIIHSPEGSHKSTSIPVSNPRSESSSPMGTSQSSQLTSPQLGTSYRRSPHVNRKLNIRLFKDNKTL
ncbi:dual specificity protein phosphatase 22-B-like [Oppia nitens]|uniref:dual specificity protein phosphatase 22-B-like n=1 Tax=Oppia nitens TaxID=1686743 RepID=UPI0023D9F79A|nr:dual specificity protein phosphatase 22-B-like [Oppia nitens]